MIMKMQLIMLLGAFQYQFQGSPRHIVNNKIIV